MYIPASIQSFETIEDAQAEVSRMQGWTTEIEEHEASGLSADDYDDNGDLIVSYAIRCDGGLYLYDDGYVK